jgi:CheY-like chemotaxis protein
MPKIDGFEVLAQLKANPDTASLPVVIVTSHVLAPEQTKTLGHARAVLLKHELSPAAWQKLFQEIGLTGIELSLPETLKPS